jgi:hypothetical protein
MFEPPASAMGVNTLASLLTCLDVGKKGLEEVRLESCQQSNLKNGVGLFIIEPIQTFYIYYVLIDQVKKTQRKQCMTDSVTLICTALYYPHPNPL